MQVEQPLEEVIVTDGPWYRWLLSAEDCVALGILGIALASGLLAFRKRKGQSWVGWILVMASLPAAFSFFAPLTNEDYSSPLGMFFNTEAPIYIRPLAAGPFLSPIALLIWQLRLVALQPTPDRAVWIASGVLTVVLAYDSWFVTYFAFSDGWFVVEVSLRIFAVAAAASLSLIFVALRRLISSAAAVSSLLMVIYVTHSAAILPVIWNLSYAELRIGFFISLLAVVIFVAEIAFTVVQDWKTDRYWAWETDGVGH